MSHDKEQQFVKGVKAGLDQSLQELDELTRARLKAARLTALDSAPPQLGGWSDKHFVLARLLNSRSNKMWLATAMSVILMLAVWVMQGTGNGGLPFEDMSLLTATEDFELYRELEFYQWLEYERERG